MKLRPFNLVPGAVFILPDETIHSVARVVRDVDIETVTIRDHGGRVFAWDFCDEVEVIGLDASLGTEREFQDIGIEYSPDEYAALTGRVRPINVPTLVSREEAPDMSEQFASDAEMQDATFDAAIEALDALGFSADDVETNEHVMYLHKLFVTEAGLEALEHIVHPPAHG